MNGLPTMSPIFAIIFALAGFGLAIILGLVLYPNREKEKASSKKSFAVPKKVKIA